MPTSWEDQSASLFAQNISDVSEWFVLCKASEALNTGIWIQMEKYSKHLEVLVAERLSLQQWGFQRGKSTTSGLIQITESNHWLWEKESDVCSLFSMQKAFNAVPHQAELAKLHSLGVDN